MTPSIQSLLERALQQVGQKSAASIKSISAEKPSVEDVLAMFNAVQRAVFAADSARDYATIALAARRILDTSNAGVAVASEAMFAVELLADHTIKLPSAPSVMTVDWATQYAFELNDAGCNVIFMALSEKGELSVSLTAGVSRPEPLPSNHRNRHHEAGELPCRCAEISREVGEAEAF